MIVKPENMDFGGQKFSVIIYGSPGVGKTTLALSAPNPVVIDFDRGMSRVKAMHRRDTIFCNTYEEVLQDLKSPEMKEYETIVVDTGGSFVTFLQDWAMRTNPQINRQKNGSISQKGFGAVKSEFVRFTNYVKDTLNKNLIYVFHALEEKDRDGNPQLRLMCEGSAKNIVWTPCDFGGCIQMIGNQRVICFTPEQEFFAKGCHGIKGQRRIPELGQNVPNDFLTRLFEEARNNIKSEAQAFEPVKKQYESVMGEVKTALEAVTDVQSANEARDYLLALNHALTSKQEASKALMEKAAQLGLRYDKKAEAFVPFPPKEGE